MNELIQLETLGQTPLSLVIDRHLASGLPSRQLELTCHVSHAGPHAVCVLDSWTKVEGPNGLRIAEGRLFYTMHNLIEGALIWPNKQTLATIVIPLSSDALKQLEERRAGGDCALRIFSRLRVCKSLTEQQLAVLAVPFETRLTSAQHGDHVEYTIPQSDWIKALRALNWSELDLIELPSITGTPLPQLVRAFKRFQEAQDFYRRGDWEETMSSCRKAIEAFIKDTTGKDDLAQAEAAFTALIPQAEKARALNEFVKSFAPFLHLARHEQVPAIPIGAKDAMLALHVTASTLAYLGK